MTAVTLGSHSAFGETDAPEPELEAEESPIYEAGFDFDFFSAYIDKNAVVSDRMVMQPCIWADLTFFEPFWFGFSIWQNYSLTDRNAATYRNGLTETDYNVHIGATAWESEDGEYSFSLELGHDFFTYHRLRSGAEEDYPDTYEVYLKAMFDNPIVNVYGRACYMYRDFGNYKQGMYYEVGFNKEVEIVESLTAGIDWNIGFGDSHYLQQLFGDVDYRCWEDGNGDEYEDYSDPEAGIGGTTVKLYLNWQVTDYLALGATIGYTGVVNGSARQGLGDQTYYEGDYWGDGAGDMYPRDLLWGGLSAHFTF